MKNQTKIVIATVLFFIAATADIYAIITGNQTLESLAKPLLLTLLAIVYLVSTRKPNFWYVFGMFFCFLGDVLLMFKGANFFMYGIGAFLLAHVIYIKITSSFLQNELTTKMITSAWPFVLFFGLLMYLIYPNLNEMFIPVLIYGITIATFGSVALLNYRGEKSTENLWLLIGAAIFIVSDRLIALNKFYEPNEFYGVTIMITYIVAQFLICKAMIVKSKG